MKISIAEQIKQGQDYLSLWPNRAELQHYFSEYNAVLVSRFVVKYCPFLAIFAVCLPLITLGLEQLSMAMFYGIIIASMPIQALFLMSKKSKEVLPPALASWYRSGVEKIAQQQPQVTTSFSLQKPTFFDLAKLLDFSYKTKSNNVN